MTVIPGQMDPGHKARDDVGFMGPRINPEDDKSEHLLERPQLDFLAPGRARLAVELPVGLGDVVGIEDGVGPGVVALREIGLDPFGVGCGT